MSVGLKLLLRYQSYLSFFMWLFQLGKASSDYIIVHVENSYVCVCTQQLSASNLIPLSINCLNMFVLNLYRCATGEAWPDIMLDGAAGRPCDPLALEYNTTTGTHRLKGYIG